MKLKVAGVAACLLSVTLTFAWFFVAKGDQKVS